MKFKLTGLVVFAWLAAVLFFAIAAAPAAYKGFCAAKSYDKMAIGIADAMKKNFPMKNLMVKTNGMSARMLGQRRFRGLYLNDNGFLLGLGGVCRRLPDRVREVSGLRDFCAKRGVVFKCVITPYRSGMLPVPWYFPDDATTTTADWFIGDLESAGVEVKDLRRVIRETTCPVEDFYLRTDNHWNFDGVLRVFPETVAFIADDDGITLPKWQRCDLPYSALGMYGRRTGSWYCGKDRISYYVPANDKGLYEAVVGKEKRRGSFSEVMISSAVLTEPTDEFMHDAYTIYPSFRKCINRKAPVNKKVLLIVDSYAKPLCAMMTTVFSQIIEIDLRRPGSKTLDEVIVKESPDIVVLAYNSTMIMQKAGAGCSWPVWKLPLINQ